MELSINLPNPFELEVEQFFAQMRIALKSAEKSYQQAINGLTAEEVENIYIKFELTKLIANDESRELLEQADPDCEDRQYLSIEINSA